MAETGGGITEIDLTATAHSLHTTKSGLKKFYGHSASMFVAAPPSRRAQAIRQCAIISGQEGEPIPFSPVLLAAKCRRYLEELVLGSGPCDIAIDSTFQRDSVVQFIAACQGDSFNLTPSNVFEVDLLCDEWSVIGKSIRKKVTEFAEHTPSSQSLWLRRLLFRLRRGLSTSEAEELLRCNLVGLVGDSAALEIPAAILSRVIDFRSYDGQREEYERVFTFCIEYLRAHGSSASQIFRTLDVTRLSNDHLVRLCALEGLNWGVLNESVGRALIEVSSELARERKGNGELQNQIEEQRNEISDLHKQVAREQSEKADLKDEIRTFHADTLRKHASELEVLKAELRGHVKELREMTEAQRRDAVTLSTRYSEGLTRTRHDIKRHFAKQDAGKPAMELTDPSPLEALPGPWKQFPPSVGKRKVKGNEVEIDVPYGIIAHLTKQCGGNVHDRKIVEVTSSEPTSAQPRYAARNVADLGANSFFYSAYHSTSEDIPRARNNWVCYDFKDRRIVPTHYAIRSYGNGQAHLKSWIIETSMDGENWREADHKEDSRELNGLHFAQTFALAGGGICRFVRLVQTGTNHNGNDALLISAWDIFGSLLE